MHRCGKQEVYKMAVQACIAIQLFWCGYPAQMKDFIAEFQKIK